LRASDHMNFIDDVFNIIDFIVKDNHKVLEIQACDLKELVNLCGGIPVPELHDVKVTAESVSKSAINVVVNCSLFTVSRRIDFGLKRIYNANMRVFNPGNDIGKTLFINQMKAASGRNFNSLTTYAQGNIGDEQWEGYVFWAKIGFIMTDWDDIEDFEDMMRYYPKPELTLGELVLDEKGCDFWRRDGFGWRGKFLLWDDSESMKQLRNYLDLKGLTWMLD
jgi:hypothetical protein